MEAELKPTRRRREPVDPDERKAELQEEGIYVTPLRNPETVIGEDIKVLTGAMAVFGDDLTDKSRAELQVAIGSIGLHAKLAEMLGEIGHVQKTGQAPSGMGGFKFTEASHLAEIIRAALSAKHISMLPERQEVSESTTFQTRNGSTQFLVTIKTTWRLTDADSGETAVFESFGSGQDSSDKAMPKAQTNALKYGLLMAWLVPQSDDPELFSNEGPGEPSKASQGIIIEASNVKDILQGGRQQQVTSAQIAAIRTRARELEMEPVDLKNILEQVRGVKVADWPDEVADQIEFLVKELETTTHAEAGNIISMLNAAGK